MQNKHILEGYKNKVEMLEIQHTQMKHLKAKQ
jgi:hypothetical protein